MNTLLSNRIQSIAESETLAMQRRSRELIAKGFDIISLSIGEPDYNTPEFIKEAAKKAIDDNFSHYPPVAGFMELRETISAKFKRDNGLDYAPNQIVVSTGAKQSIANVIMSVVNPGDEVLLPAPFWVSYADMVRLASGVPKVIYAGIDKQFKVTAEMLETHITPRTKLLIYSSPSNPTGAMYSLSELESIAHMLQKYPQIVVISDEIYELISYGQKHVSIASLPGMIERTVTVNGLSKAFAMTGYRLGYVGAPKWIADACDKFQGQITSGANTIAQRAAIAALQSDPSVVQPMVDGFKQRRDQVNQWLNQIQGIQLDLPPGAFYYFLNISAFLHKKGRNGETLRTPTDLSMYLLNEFHIATVSGEAFGCGNSIRLSYATSLKVLEEATKRLKQGFESIG
jgi:aspartate aminotransferase